MFEFASNKKTIGSFVAGFAACFSLFSTLIMSPGDLRRWALNDATNEEKVERALEPQSVTSIKLKEELRKLNNKLANNAEDFNKTNGLIRKENTSLREELQHKEAQSREYKKQSSSIEASLKSTLIEKKQLETSIVNIKQKNKELIKTLEDTGIRQNSDYDLILNEQVFTENIPVVYFDGKLSITATYTSSNFVSLNICQFFPEKEELKTKLYRGNPQTIEIAGTNYIFHLLSGSNSRKSIISTFYASKKSNG